MENGEFVVVVVVVLYSLKVSGSNRRWIIVPVSYQKIIAC